jgi:CheY-like chemotaxis protein
MSKQVLDVGNCRFDHGAIRSLIEDAFDAVVVQTHTATETLAALRERKFDLVLVNRRLERDGSSGLDLIRALKSLPESSLIPLMMITNYAEHQQRAVEAGAELGFGKSELDAPETLEKLRRFLG